MSKMANFVKIRVDENGAEKLNKGKKLGNAIIDNTKRAALGDLQNRVLRANVTNKEAAQKDLKASDVKHQNALRNTKARVDTFWKKAPLVGAGSNQTNTTNAAGQRQVLTRANSLRLNSTNNKAALSSAIGGQRHATNNAVVGQQKPKPLTVKLIENKVQHVEYINKNKVIDKVPCKVESTNSTTTLRREDSNLSRKSLTKLKAAIKGDVGTKPATKTSSATSTLVVKKEKQTPRKSADAKLSANLKIVSVQTHSSKFLSTVEDIDSGDAENLVLVSEYVKDIYDYLYTVEVEHAIRPNHLDGQEEVSSKMRAVLIDWISEVHLQFHLATETFQMAVAIIDRFLQKVKNTKRSHLQLVGVTALFIAAKYEELFPPSIIDFVYITDDTYDIKQILHMELKVFKALDCNLSRPLPIHFLRRYSKAANAEDCHHTMSKYFLELTAIEYSLAAYKPSEIAAASLFLVLHLLNDNAKEPTGFNDALWTPTLQHYSRYTAKHLRPLTKKIATIVRHAPTAKLKAVYSKYQSSKFGKISQRSELYGALMDSIVQSKE